MKKNNIPTEIMEEALLSLHEVLIESEFIALPFMLLDPFLSDVKTDAPIDKITLGIMESDLGKPFTERRKFITNYLKDLGKNQNDGATEVRFTHNRNRQAFLEFIYKEVPFQLLIVKRKYPFFEHPDVDQFFLSGDSYSIPNPIPEHHS